MVIKVEPTTEAVSRDHLKAREHEYRKSSGGKHWRQRTRDVGGGGGQGWSVRLSRGL